MPLDIQDLLNRTETIDVYAILGYKDLEDTVHVTYRPIGGNSQLNDAILDASTAGQYKEVAQLNFRELIEHRIASWNLTHNGEPINLEYDVVMERVSPELLNDISSAINMHKARQRKTRK